MSNYTDITSDGGMDPRNAYDAAAAASRDAKRLALDNCQTALATAISHLHALLNSHRTATQAWEAERLAREWLESIGSEVP